MILSKIMCIDDKVHGGYESQTPSFERVNHSGSYSGGNNRGYESY